MLQVDYIIDCTGLEADIAEHRVLADLLEHSGAGRNVLDRLDVERTFEVRGTRSGGAASTRAARRRSAAISPARTRCSGCSSPRARSPTTWLGSGWSPARLEALDRRMVSLGAEPAAARGDAEMVPTFGGASRRGASSSCSSASRGRCSSRTSARAARARASATSTTRRYWVLLEVGDRRALFWDPLYHVLMQFRWEKDWPIMFGLLVGSPRGFSPTAARARSARPPG